MRNKKVLNMVRGSKEQASDVRALLLKWGAQNVQHFKCDRGDILYFALSDTVSLLPDSSPLLQYLNYKIAELPKPRYEFRMLEEVLVRDNNKQPWRFSRFLSMRNTEGVKYAYVCTDTVWKYCIPYKGNEKLLDSSDSPI